MNSSNVKLNHLRQEIDFLDNELILTLAKRMKVAADIGKYKKEHGLLPLDENRWQAVLESRIAAAKVVGLPSVLIRNLFKHIHKHSLSVQKAIKP